MDVVPDGPLQVGAVQRGQRGHTPEAIIQQVADVRVQPVDQREAVVLPGVVLPPHHNSHFHKASVNKMQIKVVCIFFYLQLSDLNFNSNLYPGII